MFLDFVQGDTSHDSRTYKLQNEEFRNWRAQSIELRFCKFLNEAQLGMATGRVWGRFLDAQTWPAGPPLLHGSDLFNKRDFRASLAIQSLKKKKKSYPFKHRFTKSQTQTQIWERTWTIKKKLKKKKIWRTQSTKALSPILASLYLKPPRSPMIGDGFRHQSHL